MACSVVTHGARCRCDETVVRSSEPAPVEHQEVIRCACGKRASVHVTYLPRPLPMFGAKETISLCPSCYAGVKNLGQILGQQAVVSSAWSGGDDK